jgi:hypothetical protein
MERGSMVLLEPGRGRRRWSETGGGGGEWPSEKKAFGQREIFRRIGTKEIIKGKKLKIGKITE